MYSAITAGTHSTPVAHHSAVLGSLWRPTRVPIGSYAVSALVSAIAAPPVTVPITDWVAGAEQLRTEGRSAGGAAVALQNAPSYSRGTVTLLGNPSIAWPQD